MVTALSTILAIDFFFIPPFHALEPTVANLVRRRVYARGNHHQLAQFSQQLLEPMWTTKDSGSGFGLAIAREIMTEHNGQIEVINGQGEGAAFRLTLPLARNDAVSTLTEEVMAMSRELPRILIVDDDPVTCELLCEVFEREGFVARYAQSGEAALDALSDERTDVLTSDIRMKTRLDRTTAAQTYAGWRYFTYRG